MTIRCHQCSTNNLEGSEYCDECGTKLNAASVRPVSPSPQAQFAPPPPPPSFGREKSVPKPATPYLPPPPSVPQTPPTPTSMPAAQPNQTAVGSPANQTLAANGPTGSIAGALRGPESGVNPVGAPANVIRSNGDAQTRAKLVIQRGGKVGKEFSLVGTEAMIGRWDADGGIFPDVDLDQDDPEAKVSRRHARIQLHNNQFLIEDLGSTNGTFVNRGPRLLPGNKQPLNHGDEIIVGKTFLKFVLH